MVAGGVVWRMDGGSGCVLLQSKHQASKGFAGSLLRRGSGLF